MITSKSIFGYFPTLPGPPVQTVWLWKDPFERLLELNKERERAFVEPLEKRLIAF